MPKRKDAWQRIEKFHDKNRYLIPLVFVAFILIMFGINYLGPITVINQFQLRGPVLIDTDSNVLALTLLPGWVFRADVVTTKPVTTELIDLSGNIINSTSDSTLFAEIKYLDYYILRLKGQNFALTGLTYYKGGNAPYALEYALFGGGLLILLLTLTYYFIKPLRIKLKRQIKSKIDAFFYPTIIFLSIMVFWIFRNALMWVIPKSFMSIIIHAIMILIILAIVSVLSIIYKKKKAYALVFNYAITFLLLYIVSLLTYGGVVLGFNIFLINLLILGFLLFMYYKNNNKIAITYYMLVWIISLILNLAVYIIGVPVDFENVLAIPNTGGTWVLFFLVEIFMIASTYFLIKGYYSKNIVKALENGIYSGILFQGILQALVMTNVML